MGVLVLGCILYYVMLDTFIESGLSNFICEVKEMKIQGATHSHLAYLLN